LTGTKGSKEQSGISIVVIIDLDLPLLFVRINERFLTQKVNINEFIFFRIELDSGVYPDNIYYASAVSYEFEVVAT